MISLEDARARILAPLHPVASEVVPLSDAWRRVLAIPVTARLTQPPAPMSAMDGYALRAADGPAGARLPIAGAAPAGHPFPGPVPPGACIRLYTGSVVPEGADCVVIQEDVTKDADTAILNAAAIQGRHIRPKGQDFAQGDTILPAGRRLTARDIGLAAAANHPWLAVHRAPRVAILSTGDEIVMPGEPLAHGAIVSSNSHALAALIRSAGAHPVILPLAADDPAAIAAAADQAKGFDLLLTSGGASVGDHDLIQSALAPHGLKLDFWKVAMRPGKPLIHGSLGALPLLGLPGNPVSAMVCAILFLLPALARLGGVSPAPPAAIRARLAHPLPANDARADFLRGRLAHDEHGALTATAFPDQASSLLQPLAQANALILRPPHAPAAPAGEQVDVIELDPLGI